MKDINVSEVDYLAMNPDVAAAVRSGAFPSGFSHYELFGKKEGRPFGGGSHLSRKEKVLSCVNKDGLGLEIGPSHRPIAPKREGFNVHILDHLDQMGLRDKYADHALNGVKIENIESVDFVWRGEPLSELIGKVGLYDWIIASHVIEHVPDLITFFQQCEILLKPKGRLCLIIPDKRYCFDYFSACSSTGALLDAFYLKRIRPSIGQVFDYFSNSAKRGGKIAWSAGEDGEFEMIHSFKQIRELWNRSLDASEYIDSHCWRFTLPSFRLALADLTSLGLIGLQVISEFSTFGSEFFVTLEKIENSDALNLSQSDRLLALQAIKLALSDGREGEFKDEVQL